MSGNHSRRKGHGYERELVNLFRAAGKNSCRVPLSGATEFAKGDLVVNGLTGECKRRKNLPEWITAALGEHDFLCLREDRGETLVVMRLELFTTLLPNEMG